MNKVQDLNKASIRRLAQRAGIKSMSSIIWEEIRGISKVFLENLLRLVLLFTRHNYRRTVGVKDVENALKIDLLPNVDYTSLGKGGANHCKNLNPRSKSGPKVTKFKPGTKALMNIRKAQKDDCLYFPKAAFSRFVRKISSDFATDLRFSQESLDLIQIVFENYLITLFENANLCAIQAGRHRVYPKDIQLAKKISQEFEFY